MVNERRTDTSGSPAEEGRGRGEERAAKLLQEIASIDLEGVESNDDEHDIIAEIIDRARELVPASEQCGGCGERVRTLVGCPDGTEICRDCFEQGGLTKPYE